MIKNEIVVKRILKNGDDMVEPGHCFLINDDVLLLVIQQLGESRFEVIDIRTGRVWDRVDLIGYTVNEAVEALTEDQLTVKFLGHGKITFEGVV